jgi:hypothetical protein
MLFECLDTESESGRDKTPNPDQGSGLNFSDMVILPTVYKQCGSGLIDAYGYNITRESGSRYGSRITI